MRIEAENWWKQAQHDLQTADYLKDGGRLDAAIFYVQQAVEKALKALHIHFHKTASGPTHSLTKLARDCGVPGGFTGFLRRLTPEYFLSRYPDASGDLPYELYDEEELKATLDEAREVLRWVEQQLTRSSET